MEEPIDEVYFKWLYSKVASVEVPTPSLTFYTLLGYLHSFEFVWLVSGDDNRAEDGLDIRKEFLIQSHMDRDPYWMGFGCSVFEMLIAFSRRAEFETDVEARDWFWIFLENLEIDDLCDAMGDFGDKVVDIIDQFVWRTYDRNGVGGLFPLEHAEHDQRKVEVWYQFCAWIVDKDFD
jgi:hypothetical protein